MLTVFSVPSLTTKEDLLLSADLRESFKLQGVFQAVPSPSRKTETAGSIPMDSTISSPHTQGKDLLSHYLCETTPKPSEKDAALPVPAEPGGSSVLR